mmetsp:Transcript_10894/g.10405  ORF Transcript_10894/g.10405 Transcript_10894/m.10405 type:complete len:85 (+) Transcript_10894:36-290(+)
MGKRSKQSSRSKRNSANEHNIDSPEQNDQEQDDNAKKGGMMSEIMAAAFTYALIFVGMMVSIQIVKKFDSDDSAGNSTSPSDEM